MKRTFLVVLSLAALTAACESTSTPPATTTDTVSGSDAKTGSDTGTTADTATTGDSATTNDTASTDATTTDTATTDTKTTDTAKDTTPEPVKCDQSDNLCINQCAQKECKAEQAACTSDKACFGLSSCLNGCAQGVSPPADVTGSTCEGKCLTLAGDDAAKKYDTFSGCALDKCVVCTEGKPGYDQCITNCAIKQCIPEVEACSKSEGCSKILKCLETNQCKDQGCAVKCMNESDNDGKFAFNAVSQCVVGAQESCK